MAEISDFTKVVTLLSGEEVTLRLLQQDDAGRLGDYLRGLSAESKARFGPHAFDQATVDQICANLDPAKVLRLVAVTQAAKPKIVGYVILELGVSQHEQARYGAYGLPLDLASDSTLAPSVADDYQDKKLGSALLPYLIELAQRLGRKRIVLMGGTQATNPRAIHFYEKFGFKKVGEFEYNNLNNYDMILNISDVQANI